MIHHNHYIARTIVYQWITLTAFIISQTYHLSTGFPMPMIQHHHRAISSSSVGAFPLTSAWESCVPDTIAGVIQWIDVTESREDTFVEEIGSDCCTLLPLYPLSSACYLPTGQHQLRNTEPRNLKMALDLGIGGRFCVVLAALDTGRIASVGTVFRILDMDPQNDPASGELIRILLKCQAEELVDIQKIHNSHVQTWENRLKRSSEYLVATVCLRHETRNNTERVQQIAHAMLQDYNLVSQLYQKSIGANDLPPFSRERLEEVLPSRGDDGPIENVFWQIAQAWQTLCHTVREGHQITLMSDRNELLIDAAIRKGGPLNLPVHVEDLLLEDRQKVQDLEVQAQQQWLSLQLDPSIDFQALLSFSTFEERLEHLASMIRRERTRLEQILQTDRNENEDLGHRIRMKNNKPKNKGAWFDDNAWS